MAEKSSLEEGIKVIRRIKRVPTGMTGSRKVLSVSRDGKFAVIEEEIEVPDLSQAKKTLIRKPQVGRVSTRRSQVNLSRPGNSRSPQSRIVLGTPRSEVSLVGMRVTGIDLVRPSSSQRVILGSSRLSPMPGHPMVALTGRSPLARFAALKTAPSSVSIASGP
jgi:hypothetical protein